MNLAPYCFRVPFRLSERTQLGIETAEWVLNANGAQRGTRVWVQPSAGRDDLISAATSLVIRGEGYDEPEVALREGERWRDALQASFARMSIGADFGDRAPRSHWTEAGLQLVGQQVGSRVLNDQPGVMVFECTPEPRFVGGTVRAVVTKSGERIERVVDAAASSGPHMGDRERLSFDLFSASFFQPAPDGRLLMLMMAIETLLELQPRPAVSVAHVEQLISLTREASLEKSEIQSILGSLEWLKDESIGQAGRALVRTLDPRQYMGVSAAKFFTKCYDMRSALTHGKLPRPPAQDVDLLASNLETMVGHLLCGPTLLNLDFDS